MQIWRGLFINKKECIFSVPLNNVLSGSESFEVLTKVFGKHATNIIHKGLQSLVNNFYSSTETSPSCILIGPVIEGVGFYPKLDGDLKLASKRDCWVVGDATGIFRGIVASLLSGFYVMEQILLQWNSTK